MRALPCHVPCHDGISALIKELPESSVTPSSCEETVRGRLSVNQEAGPHQTLNLLVP